MLKNSNSKKSAKSIQKKQYFVSILVSIGITGMAVGLGYSIDQLQNTFPTYILIGFVVSGPLSVWANYSLLKKRLINSTDAREEKEKTHRV